MLRTDEVKKLLLKNKDRMNYEDIWKSVKDKVIPTIGKEMSEDQLKADLYMSLIEDKETIMVGDNNWDLKERYSLDNLEVIEKSRMTEETELVWEESEDTKELKLGILYKDDK